MVCPSRMMVAFFIKCLNLPEGSHGLTLKAEGGTHGLSLEDDGSIFIKCLNLPEGSDPQS